MPEKLFNRETFMALSGGRLYTPDQVADLIEEHILAARKEERERIISLIARKAPEMDGKKLFCTVLELCQIINEGVKNDGR